MVPADTVEQSVSQVDGLASRPPEPGLLLVFSGTQPHLAPLPLAGGTLELGRDSALLPAPDTRMSRQHVRVEQKGDVWTVTDLGSRNGTYVNGERVVESVTARTPIALRAGESLFLFSHDLRQFAPYEVQHIGGAFVGPRLAKAWDEIKAAAAGSLSLHVTGESGVGKELAANEFHATSQRRRGPFVAVNCATIPANLAERLLFGAKRGAYSGADADTSGYLQAAHGGTLSTRSPSSTSGSRPSS
jgi:transcriptional regulator of aromatic amino acid metabolism